MTQTFRIAIVSDIHYAAEAERVRCANFDFHTVKNPLARIAGRVFHHFVWLRKHGAHNHLLDRFLAEAGQPDLVVANGDHSCDTGLVGVSDKAAFASVEECLGKLRGRFGGKFRATLGDHELGKVGLFSGRGSMQLASWRCAVEGLRIEPFWRVQLGNHVLLGVASSLIALPVFQPDSPAAEHAEWERLREIHLHEIRRAFTALKPGERVLLFCHDPTALPFLWREEVIRQRISQVEQTVIGHLHSPLVFRNSRVLSGLPAISFLGRGTARISAALREARFWQPFRIRLCPALTGIQLLKDGGYLTAELAADASVPIRFEFHPIKW